MSNMVAISNTPKASSAGMIHFQLLKNEVFLLFLLAVAASTSEARQRFDREPERREINPGEDTVMLCRVFEKNRNSLCIWQKDGKPVRLQDGKYEWDGSRENGDCSIRILNSDIHFDDGKNKFMVHLSKVIMLRS